MHVLQVDKLVFSLICMQTCMLVGVFAYEHIHEDTA